MMPEYFRGGLVAQQNDIDNQLATRGRNERALVFLIIGVQLCITVPLANLLNIWIDEAYTLFTTSGSFMSTMKGAREFEMQPPVYFAELWMWRQLSESITLARLNSVIAAAAAVWFVYLAARRWIKNVPPVYVAGLYAVNAYLLWAAVEIRPYSFVQLFCALLLVLFYDGFYAEKPKRVSQVLYAVTALTALYTYYFLGFVLVAMAASLLIDRRWKRLGVYVAWMAGVGAFFIPELLYVRGHVETVAAIKEAPTGILRAAEYVAGHVFSLPFALPPLPKTVRWVVGTLLALVVALSLFVMRKRATPETRALWAILLVLGTCYGVVVRSIMREDDLTERHLMIMIIPSALALFSVTGLYAARTRRLVIAGFATLWIGFNAYAVYWMFNPMAKSGDYKRVAAYLEEHQRPGAAIAIATSHAALPFRHYYRGSGMVYPLPFEDNYDRYVIERWQFQSPEHVRASIAPAVSKDGILWLFTDRGADAAYFGVDLNFEYLEEVLAEDFDLVSEQNFFNAKVRQFRVHTKADYPAEMTSTPSTAQPSGGVSEATMREGAAVSATTPPAPTRRGGPPPVRDAATTGVFGSAPAGAGAHPSNGSVGQPGRGPR